MSLVQPYLKFVIVFQDLDTAQINKKVPMEPH